MNNKRMQLSLAELTLIPTCQVWDVFGKLWCGWLEGAVFHVMRTLVLLVLGEAEV